MKPKYVLCPGKVTNRTDGQCHYIGPNQLARLYGVRITECEIHEPAPWWPESYYRMAEERQLGLPRLEPRYDGNYELHNVKVRGPEAALSPEAPTRLPGSATDATEKG